MLAVYHLQLSSLYKYDSLKDISVIFLWRGIVLWLLACWQQQTHTRTLPAGRNAGSWCFLSGIIMLNLPALRASSVSGIGRERHAISGHWRSSAAATRTSSKLTGAHTELTPSPHPRSLTVSDTAMREDDEAPAMSLCQ